MGDGLGLKLREKVGKLYVYLECTPENKVYLECTPENQTRPMKSLWSLGCQGIEDIEGVKTPPWDLLAAFSMRFAPL
ncbi:hypothetical protein QVD17_10540 [Tagetes erecta]|uniref:Uncharacterized protein n=1 Tax=Tagetes erecta TaxID=13708 RepID=A0AAD8L6Q3_TARER|nr:hypothetical protein QVD17_10540 [Tagetes erecta]